MSTIGSSISALPKAISGAFTDFTTVFEFTAVNYATALIRGAVQPMIPPGIPPVLILGSIDAAGEVAKLMLWSSAKDVTPPATN